MQLKRPEGGQPHPHDRSGVLIALALVSTICCAHHQSPPATGAKTTPAPGARTEAERTHVLEAQWVEVEVKGQKQGDQVVSAVKLVQPKIRIFHAAPPPDAPGSAQKERPSQPNEVVDLNELLHKITPLDVDHIDILDGQVAFVDTSRKERPELWLHDLQLSVENRVRGGPEVGEQGLAARVQGNRPRLRRSQSRAEARQRQPESIRKRR